MMWRLFALDTGFFSSLGSYEFAARCEMLRELGYDGTYLTLWTERSWLDLKELATVRARHGIDVVGVYATVDVSGQLEDGPNARVVRLVNELGDVANVEVALLDGGKRKISESAVLDMIGALTDHAARQNSKVVLYPHVGTYLDNVAGAVTMCETIGGKALRMAFSGFHWYAGGGGSITSLRSEVERAAPFLESVSLCGCRYAPAELTAGLGATVEPLDEGELDNFAVMGVLQDVAYRGPVGIQGYSLGGDAYGKLRRSYEAFRSMERRLEQHSSWAALRPDPLPEPSRS